MKNINIIRFSIYFIICIFLTSCDNPSENENPYTTISGNVTDACNQMPVKNLHVTLAGRYSSGIYLGRHTSTDSVGNFSFTENTEGIDYYYVYVNSVRSPNIIDTNYSNYISNPHTELNIELQPRVDGVINAQPKTGYPPAELIRQVVYETGGGLRGVESEANIIAGIYYKNSLQIKLGANFTHRVEVEYIRNNTISTISKEFSVDCSGNFRVDIFY